MLFFGWNFFLGGGRGGTSCCNCYFFIVVFVANAVTDCWIMAMIYSPKNS